MKKSRRRSLPGKKLLLGLAATACVLGAAMTSFSAAAPIYTDWSAPVNVGPIVNSANADGSPTLSADGLSLYFDSDRPGGFGGRDIWVSHRATLADPWGPPVNL